MLWDTDAFDLAETVISEEMVLSAEVREGPAARRGVQYEVANGIKIPNLGEKKFVATSSEGIKRHITAQVCDVTKSRLSLSKIV